MKEFAKVVGDNLRVYIGEESCDVLFYKKFPIIRKKIEEEGCLGKKIVLVIPPLNQMIFEECITYVITILENHKSIDEVVCNDLGTAILLKRYCKITAGRILFQAYKKQHEKIFLSQILVERIMIDSSYKKQLGYFSKYYKIDFVVDNQLMGVANDRCPYWKTFSKEEDRTKCEICCGKTARLYNYYNENTYYFYHNCILIKNNDLINEKARKIYMGSLYEC